MGYLTGDDRNQPNLLPPAIDEYVDQDAPVRVVDASVDTLNFRTLGFNRAAPASTGRPGYDPRDLLKLYIYGYLNDLRSSRRLERECKRNVELMWLMRRLAPDHKTIADFRRDGGTAIVGACRAFVLFCREQGLFVAKLVSIDGAKFRAAAIVRTGFLISKGLPTRSKKSMRASLTIYPLWTKRTMPRSPATMTARRVELNRLAEYLDQDDRRLIVNGELEARPIGSGPGGKPPSYNVQIAADAATGIVVHYAVTDEVNDLRMLYPMPKAVKELLDREELTVVADTGYSNGNAAAACEADNITACVLVKRFVNNRGDGDWFERPDFTYNAEEDSFSCPAGRMLARTWRDDPPEHFLYFAELLRLRTEIPLHDSEAPISDAARPRGRARADDVSGRGRTRADAAAKMLGGTSVRDDKADDDGALPYPGDRRDEH